MFTYYVITKLPPVS